MVEVKDNLLYSQSHHWLKIEGNIVTLGITDFGQDKMGKILFIDLPEEGDNVFKDQGYGSVESENTVTEIYSPVNGNVISVNEDLFTNPELVNDSCYSRGWLVQIRLENMEEVNSFLSPEEYRDFLHEN
ncbi:MAG: glycine cleavage system protein GcvH [Spirochaetes bacterium]|nr:glycine cleavage system protein GcvH [Spirochaetota bacterium]